MLKSIELNGFKSFARKSEILIDSPTVAIVGPNGSGKSNVAEAFRFVLGEQSMKSLRCKRGEDLIWAGNKSIPRANRASVKVVFDNSNKILDIDFDEVVIERIVYRDGTNEYFINKSKVRLKDVVTLLASANIGSSGHHIISQGEADRILNATPLQRREILEDALGLRIFHYRKNEAFRKLKQTSVHIQEVEASIREIKPRFSFLQRQMEKRQKAQELKDSLKKEFSLYFTFENSYLQELESHIKNSKDIPKQKITSLEKEIETLKAKLAQLKQKPKQDKETEKELQKINKQIEKLQDRKNEILHLLGVLDGKLEVLPTGRQTNSQFTVSKEKLLFLRSLLSDLKISLSEASPAILKHSIEHAVSSLTKFLADFDLTGGQSVPNDISLQRQKILQQKTQLEKEKNEIDGQLKQLFDKRLALQKQEGQNKDDVYKIQIEIAQKSAQLQELKNEMNLLEIKEKELQERKSKFEEDVAEIIALGIRPVESNEKISAQEASALKNAIQKKKILLEELGSVDEAFVDEYKQVKERIEFLEGELADLKTSGTKLVQLIKDIDKELSLRFESGILKINEVFAEFFAILFGGGTAKLKLVKEDTQEDAKDGIEIAVAIPRKKVSTLEALSGGERALTSIALIFAMSQVNPPPFLILDETDAALDEANSRRYAEMIVKLSQKSQLILITHNRETMVSAGELYGVTMGADGVSKLLSVKLEEALSVAKS